MILFTWVRRRRAQVGRRAPPHSWRANLTSAPETRRAEPKHVVGLATHTTNAAESDLSTAKIPALWSRFTSERWPERLEQFGAFGPTLAVYSAYENEVSGAYQLLVGRELRGSSAVSAPLEVVTVSRGQYLTFSCPGPLPRAVIEGWRDVWAYFARPNAPLRAYTADFEIYADAGPVEIWVAVRER